MVAELTPLRGRPAKGSVIREEMRHRRHEEANFVRRARYLGLKAIYGGMYQPEVAVAAGEALVHLAERRIRQIEGPQ